MQRYFSGLILSACLALPAFAQDGGKLDWKGKTSDPRDAIAVAKAEGKPLLLFFSSETSKPCIEMSNGAFSDPKVVEASKDLWCVFVECTWGTKNLEVMARYKVTGYPTILLCDPDGNMVSSMVNKSPETVAEKLRAHAEQYRKAAPKPDPSVPKPTGFTVAEATAEAKKAGKPLAIYFFDDSPGTLSVNAALMDESLKETRRRLVFSVVEYRKGSDECRKYDVTRAPAILVLDIRLAKPEENPLARIVGSRSARELKRDLEAALVLGGEAPAKEAGPTAGDPPKARPAETLSDDEIERKFIQARVAVALDLQKKGKKDKAIEMLEDIVKSFPKHVDTPAVQKLLDEARK